MKEKTQEISGSVATKTLETVQSIGEKAKQTVQGAWDAAKGTTQKIKETLVGKNEEEVEVKRMGDDVVELRTRARREDGERKY